MVVVSNIFLWIVNNLLQQTPVILGLVVVAGMIASKKSVSQILMSFIKTIIGYQIFVAGIGVFIAVINYLQAMIAYVFAVPPLVMESQFIANYSQYYGPVIGLGFLLHLVIERFLVPKKLRYVYMGGGHFLLRQAVLSTGIAVIIYGETNLLFVILWGTVLSAIWYTVNPIITRKFIKEVRGDDLAGYGHQSSSIAWLTCILSRWLGKKENSTEEIKFPKGMMFMRDMGVSIAVIQAVLLLGFGIACGGAKVQEIAGITSDPWIWLVLQAMVFAAGFMILTYGLRTMMGELIPSFSGISEKIIPGSRPALDVPTVFPYGTNAVLIGSTLSIGIFLVYMVIFRVTGFASIFPMVPSLFMSGAGVAVFGNKVGGIRGAVIAGFVTATAMAFGLCIMQVLGGQFYTMEWYVNIGGEADDMWLLYPIMVALGRLIFGKRAIPFGVLGG